jgi:signal transduction histidine kinase
VVIASQIPSVMGHEAYVTQIMSNLLTNAAKFVMAGVRPKITIHSNREAGMVRIVLEDNGVGVAPENQKQIFKIFGRVYSEKQYEGTGIGLAIAKKAAERMGGSIQLESELGRGSKFIVMLRQAP